MSGWSARGVFCDVPRRVAFAAVTRPGAIAFGFGDVMLGMLSGFMLGWRAFIFASLITVFAGAAGAVLYLIGLQVVGRRYRWFTPLPYGPYIVIGTLVMLLFRKEVGTFCSTAFERLAVSD